MKRLVLAVLLFGLSARAEEPPRALSCLARWYNLKPLHTDAGWVALLPSGERIPFDLGPRTVEQRLEDPALRDLFTPPYRRGPWKQETDPTADPGRARVDAIFKATYGATLEAVTAQTVELDFFGTQLRVHTRAADAFRRVTARLAQLTAADASLRLYLGKPAGTLAWRRIAGTDRASAHSFGIALDLNAARSHYWRWTKAPLKKSDLPPSLIAAFEDEGFIWGGRWFHFDTMHFEWRPELFDPACQEPL